MHARNDEKSAPNLKKELYYIFTYYCSFADRENYESLKIQNFRRLLTDAQLVSNNDEGLQMKLDLLFSKLKRNGNGIDFQLFLSLIYELAKLFFAQEDCQQGARKLVNENFHALYQFIFENTDFGQSIRYLSKTCYSQSCFILLRSISSTLYRIYLHFFDINAIRAVKQRPDIFKRITNFTKNFEITPQLMTKTESFMIFNHVLDEEGDCAYKQWFQVDKHNKHSFLYFDFIRFLFIVSLTVNRKIVGVEVSHFHKMVYFLQMLEISAGFAKFCKLEQVNLHLIPNQKLVKQLETKNDDFGISPINLSPAKKGVSNLPDLNQNYNGLRQKFTSLCLQGQSIGSCTLSHKKAINLIMDMKLGLKQSQIEVYLASSKKMIQFETLMEVLQKIAEKETIDLQQIIDKMMSMPLAEQIKHERLKTSRNSANMNRKQYRNCVAMIEIVQKMLKSAFMAECEPVASLKNSRSNQLAFVSLTTYLKIMHDFQLSPLYITKQSLIDVFRQSIKKSYDFMTFAQFKDSFIIAIPYLSVGESQQLQPQSKLIIIFERINESRGASRLWKKAGVQKEDNLVKLRQIFGQFYHEEPAKVQNNSRKMQQILE